MGGSSKSKDKANYKKREGAKDESKGELPIRDEDQVYGVISALYGNKWVGCHIYGTKPPKNMRCHVAGRLHKCKLNVGDHVLISMREFEGDKGDVILRFNDIQTQRLFAAGEFGEALIATGTSAIHADEETNYEFTDVTSI